MRKPKTMTLRIDEARAEALANLLEHVGGGTTSKAIWRAIREFPAQAEALRTDREALADLRHKADCQTAELADLRTALADLTRWARKSADFMSSIALSGCDLFYFPRTETDDTQALDELVDALEACGWRERFEARGSSTLSGQ